MAARRILLRAALRDPSAFSRSAADGRMGYLLYGPALARRLMIPIIGRLIFAAAPAAEEELPADLPPMLDRIDAWICDGVLGGAQPHAADFMVAPSLALILYRSGCPGALGLRAAREIPVTFLGAGRVWGLARLVGASVRCRRGRVAAASRFGR